MEKIILLLNKILVGITLLFVFACGEDNALKEEYLYFNEENKTWIPNDSLGGNFVMIDQNGISQSFALSSESYEFGTSTSSYFGVKTKKTKTEYQYKKYSSSYGHFFSVSLTAGFEPFGDELYLDMNGIGFAYDFKFKTVSRVSTNVDYKSKLMTDKGYELEDEEIYSNVDIISNYKTSYKEYDTVLVFQLKDFEVKWDDFTVVKIVLAPKTGLIQYLLKGGIEYERIPE